MTDAGHELPPIRNQTETKGSMCLLRRSTVRFESQRIPQVFVSAECFSSSLSQDPDIYHFNAENR